MSVTVFDIFLVVLAIILMLIGFIGCALPALPGTPLCWAGLLCRKFMTNSPFTWRLLIIAGIITIAVEIINNFVPAVFTKKAGGSRAGSIGSTVGSIAGVFTGQIWLIIFGSFIGAFAGELIHDYKDGQKALKSALMSFLGFITGTGLRLIVSAIWISIYIKSFF
ncbi:MAG: DUF456 domain-containing protein [Treponema sp.]|nr:DUF456 domain-containing protein [Treponema sp.]